MYRSINSLAFRGGVIVSLTMLFFLSACSKENKPGPAVPPTDTIAPYKNYLALGDSYTIGTSVTATERFPVQTTALLSSSNILINQPDIRAINGWTTNDLLHSLTSEPPVKTYDLVSLLIGVNNQYQHRSQEEYRIKFTELVTKAIEYAGGRRNRVFVLSIPDYSVTPFAQYSDTVMISNEIDQFNAINEQVSAQMGVKYLTITQISREGRTDPTMQASDGLHPSGKQYQRWSALLAPMMKASL